MSSNNASFATSAVQTPAPHPFTLRLVIGLVGVLIAALSSGLNDRVTGIAMDDLRGIMGVGHDEGTWLTSVYVAAEVAAMMIAAWCAVTFSFRRFAIVVCLGFAGLAAFFPFVHSYSLLLAMRGIQGMFGGMLPPLLMTAALRFLPPGIKLYGMGCYALTATFGPNLAMPLAAFWTDTVGWQFVYWQIIGPCVLGAAMISYGMPQDPVRLERFRQFDWIGVLAGCSGMVMLVLGLEQGERLDWFSSSLICSLLAGAAVLLTIFLINEWNHPLPLFKLQLLGRRNFSHGLIGLAGILIISMAGGILPTAYLMEVHGYRPLEIGPLALIIALPQLVICPFAAYLCTIRKLDSRIVMGTGFLLMAAACLGGTVLTSEWIRDNFFVLHALQALGLPLVVVPVLMGATGAVQPMEGPFASAMFNTVRGISTVVGSALIETFISHREKLHSNVLLDRAANSMTLMAGNGTRTPTALMQFAGRVREQALVLSVADAFLILMVGALVMILLMLAMPQRAFPPQSNPSQFPK